MVQPKHEEGVAVVENTLIDRLLVSGLVDALKNCDRVSRCFAGDLLKTQCRAVKEFQGTRDTLKELRGAPLVRFIIGPRHPAHFGHRRKAIFYIGEIALRLPRIAPTPVDA